MTQTLLTIREGILREFPVSIHRSLKDRAFLQPGHTVYGYILNRASEFVDPLYGWGLLRN